MAVWRVQIRTLDEVGEGSVNVRWWHAPNPPIAHQTPIKPTDAHSDTSIPTAEELSQIVPRASSNSRPRLNRVFVAQFASIEACQPVMYLL